MSNIKNDVPHKNGRETGFFMYNVCGLQSGFQLVYHTLNMAAKQQVQLIQTKLHANQDKLEYGQTGKTAIILIQYEF